MIQKKDLLGFRDWKKIHENPTKAAGASGIQPPPKERYCWQILAGEKAEELDTVDCKQSSKKKISQCMSANTVKVTLASNIPDKVILIAPNAAVFPLDVPKDESKGKSPDVSTPKPLSMRQYDAVWIDVAVKDASKVASVEANQLALKYRIPEPGKDGKPSKTIQVEVTRDLTAKPGNVDITVLNKDGKPVGSTRIQIVSRHDKNDKGGKP
jgi:hypothetical protein